MAKLNLKDVTLLMFEHKDYERAKQAIEVCTHYCDFHDIKLYGLIDDPDVIKVDSLNYHDYIFIKGKGLNDYFDSDFCLSIEWDGFILNPGSWTDNFLNYDYIGASWLKNWKDLKTYGVINNDDDPGGVLPRGIDKDSRPYFVMNGGFCLRSKILQEIIIEDPYIHDTRFTFGRPQDDELVTVIQRGYLEKVYGIKYPPGEIFEQFSVEGLRQWKGSFGFHDLITDISGWEDAAKFGYGFMNHMGAINDFRSANKKLYLQGNYQLNLNRNKYFDKFKDQTFNE